MKLRSVVCSTIALVACAACAGPSVPLSVGQQRDSLNLVLGALTAAAKVPVPTPALPALPPALPGLPVAPAPLPASVLAAAPSPAPIASSVRPTIRAAAGRPTPKATVTSSAASPTDALTPPSLAPSPAACPTATATSPISGIATGTISSPPKAATYSYRTVTTVMSGTTSTVTDGLASVSIQNVSTPDSTGSFTYDLAFTLNGATTVTTYSVVNGATVTQTDPNNLTAAAGVAGTVPTLPLTYPATPGVDGFYETRQISPTGTFSPVQPLLITELPVVPNTSYTVMGTSGATTEKYTSTTTARTTVDACGHRLDSNGLSLASGMVVTVGATPSTFVTDIDLGTGYGGIPLAWKTTVSNTTGGATAGTVVEATINQVPEQP